jgi:hypothetical protein
MTHVYSHCFLTGTYDTCKCYEDIGENVSRLQLSFCILRIEGFHSAFHEVNLLLKLLCSLD